MRRQPLFAGAVVVLLGVGIGANTLVFSLVNELLLKPLPVRDPESLWLVQTIAEHNVRPNASFAYHQFRDVVQPSGIFTAAVAEQEWSQAELMPLGAGNSVRLAMAQMVSPNYFEELGITAAAGRLLTTADATATGSIPAVLSYQFWSSQFGRDPAVVGRSIRLKNAPFTVVGVLPREFHSSDIDRAPDVRLPISASPSLRGREITERVRGGAMPGFRILVRLPAGVSAERATAALAPRVQAEQDAEERRANAAAEHPVPPAELEAEILADHERMLLLPIGRGVSQLRDQFSRALWLLLGGVGLLLLAVCANVAGLLVARSTQRRREMSVRLAVGASRGQLVRQLLVENLLLAIPGAVLGAGFAYALAPVLVGLLPPPRDFGQLGSAQLLTVSPDLRVLGFAAAVTAFCVLAFGLLPAWRASRVAVHAELKASKAPSHTTAAALAPVALQVAFGVVLLAAAGLLLRTFWKLDHLDLGYDRAHLVEFTFDPPDAGYNAARTMAFYRALRERVAALPGVRSAAFAGLGVMRAVGMKTTVAPQGVVLPPKTFLNCSLNMVTAGYFETMGMSLLEGRKLAAADGKAQPTPIVVNRAFADAFFPRQDAVGRYLAQGTDGSKAPNRVIVGVMSTGKYRSLREMDAPTLYYTIDEDNWRGSLILYVRTWNPPVSMVQAVRQAAAQIDAGVPLLEGVTLEQEVRASLWQERLVAILAAFFGAVSLVLAAIGLYSALAQSVTARTHELGIRIAIGAEWRHIVRAVCGPLTVAVGCGAAAGALASALLLRVTAKLLFGVEPGDPVSMAAAVAFVVGCAAVAAAAPARRASRIDPAAALRSE